MRISDWSSDVCSSDLLVEIAKALSKRVRLLILDEPTASLNESDSNALLDLLVSFKQQGITSILISHKLNEIARVADTVTILRDGTTVETLDRADKIGRAHVELQSLMRISYAVFCLKKKITKTTSENDTQITPS